MVHAQQEARETRLACSAARQRGRRSGPHPVSQQGVPTQPEAHGPQGLPCPAPEVEMIALAQDQSIAEREPADNAVVHGPAGSAEGVHRLPRAGRYRWKATCAIGPARHPRPDRGTPDRRSGHRRGRAHPSPPSRAGRARRRTVRAHRSRGQATRTYAPPPKARPGAIGGKIFQYYL